MCTPFRQKCPHKIPDFEPLPAVCLLSSHAFLLAGFDYPGSFEAPAREQDTSDYPLKHIDFVSRKY